MYKSEAHFSIWPAAKSYCKIPTYNIWPGLIRIHIQFTHIVYLNSWMGIFLTFTKRLYCIHWALTVGVLLKRTRHFFSQDKSVNGIGLSQVKGNKYVKMGAHMALVSFEKAGDNKSILKLIFKPFSFRYCHPHQSTSSIIISSFFLWKDCRLVIFLLCKFSNWYKEPIAVAVVLKRMKELVEPN